ncbi:hypothetical protein HED60_05445 [Planctomycetales bacterium ZRK34]|nr:hypothetical protein HED60_05445 [Planctomycetales bacterium ZRK34]
MIRHEYNKWTAEAYLERFRTWSGPEKLSEAYSVACLAEIPMHESEAEGAPTCDQVRALIEAKQWKQLCETRMGRRDTDNLAWCLVVGGQFNNYIIEKESYYDQIPQDTIRTVWPVSSKDVATLIEHELVMYLLRDPSIQSCINRRLFAMLIGGVVAFLMAAALFMPPVTERSLRIAAFAAIVCLGLMTVVGVIFIANALTTIITRQTVPMVHGQPKDKHDLERYVVYQGLYWLAIGVAVSAVGIFGLVGMTMSSCFRSLLAGIPYAP